jgi:hypothetical protein
MKALAAEVTANFGKRLAPLGLTVRELTGARLLAGWLAGWLLGCLAGSCRILDSLLHDMQDSWARSCGRLWLMVLCFASWSLPFRLDLAEHIEHQLLFMPCPPAVCR